MLAIFLITFREVFEIVLVVGVVLSFLHHNGHHSFKSSVYYSAILGVLFSGLFAVLISRFAGSLGGASQEIFESAVLFGGAAFIVAMVLWLKKFMGVDGLRVGVALAVEKKEKLSIFFLVFIAVFREGMELALYLEAAGLSAATNGLLMGVLGVLFAFVFGYLLFVQARRIPLKKMFTVTSIVLVFFGASLLTHGIHNWSGGGEPKAEEVMEDYTGRPLIEFFEEVGEMVFGHEGEPSWLEIVMWMVYLSGVGLVVSRKRSLV